jgi:hypothetical protein
VPSLSYFQGGAAVDNRWKAPHPRSGACRFTFRCGPVIEAERGFRGVREGLAGGRWNLCQKNYVLSK